MNSAVEYEIWLPKNSVKDVNQCTTFSGYMFIMMNTCVEPAIHFRCAECRRIVHWCFTDSLNNACFELKLFLLFVWMPNHSTLLFYL